MEILCDRLKDFFEKKSYKVHHTKSTYKKTLYGDFVWSAKGLFRKVNGNIE